MKKIVLVISFFTFFFSLMAQNATGFTKKASKYLKNQNYAEASLHAIKALRLKPKTKKAQEILSLSFQPAVEELQSSIKELEEESAEFVGDVTVILREKVYSSYVKLRELDRGAMEISRTVKSKKYNLKFDKLYYKDEMFAAKDLLQEAKEQAAEMHYTEAKVLMANNDRMDSKNAAKKLRKAFTYVPDYKDSKVLFEEAKKKGTARALVLNFTDISGFGNFGSLEKLVPLDFQKMINADDELNEFISFKTVSYVKNKAIASGIPLPYKITFEWVEENAEAIGIDVLITGEIINIKKYLGNVINDSPVAGKKNVVIGTRKVQGDDGKWREKNVYGDVHATVYRHSKRADATVKADIAYIDFKYGIGEAKGATAGSKWKNVWITYRGDERAIPSYLLRENDGEELSFPSNYEFAKIIADTIAEKMVETFSKYIK